MAVKRKILKNMLEVHKPSHQVTCIYERDGKPVGLEPFQYDALNYFCYQAREQINQKIKIDNGKTIEELDSDDELFNFLRNQQIEINLDDVAGYTKKYTSKNNRGNMMRVIRQLEDTKVTVGIFKTSDMMVENRFSLISRTQKITNSKTITMWLEPELILGWVFGAEPFAKLYLTIQTQLPTTYAKILYEICKDYLGGHRKQTSITKKFDLWKQVLHLEAENISRLKYNFLNRAMEAINQKTDVEITKISSKKEKGINYMTVDCRVQDRARLESLGLIMGKNPHYNRSAAKMKKLIASGNNITSEEGWIAADIKNFGEEYDHQDKIDNWLEETDQEVKEALYEQIAKRFEKCTDPLVTVNKKYKFEGLYTGDEFTSTAIETLGILNDAILANEDFDIKE